MLEKMHKNIKPSVNSYLIELLQVVKAEFVLEELLYMAVQERHQSLAEISF